MTSRAGYQILVAVVVGPLLLDFANGLLGEGRGFGGFFLTPGEAGRGLLFIAALLVMARKRGRFFRLLQWSFVGLLVLGMLGPLRGLALGGSLSALAFDVEKLVKTLYAPATAALFLTLFLTYRVQLDDLFGVLALWGGLAGAGLVFFNVTGVGSATYGEFGSAFKGLYLAQNDVGLGMIVALAAGVRQVIIHRRTSMAVLVVGTVAGMLTLGTRAATVGAFVVVLGVAFAHREHLRSALRSARGAVFFLTLVGLVLIGAQARYRTIRSEPFQLRKYEKVLEGNFTRLISLAGAAAYVSQRPAVTGAIGEGAYRYQQGVGRQLSHGRGRALVLSEVDWMDLFGAHGFLFVAALYLYYLFFLFRTSYLTSRAGSAARWTTVIMMSSYLVHATLAGHAMSGALPAGLIAPLIGYVAGERVFALARERVAPHGDHAIRYRATGMAKA